MTRDKILTFPDLAERGIRLGRSQLARLEKAGKFPLRVRISDNRIGWLERDIDAYLTERIRARG